MHLHIKSNLERGTGKKIRVNGYCIGCQTVTQENKVLHSRTDLWTLTNVAYFPAEKIQNILCLQLSKDYKDGVQTPAPMTKKLIENIIKYKDIEPSTNPQKIKTNLSQNKTVTVARIMQIVSFIMLLGIQHFGCKVVGFELSIKCRRVVLLLMWAGSEVILYIKNLPKIVVR